MNNEIDYDKIDWVGVEVKIYKKNRNDILQAFTFRIPDDLINKFCQRMIKIQHEFQK